MLRITQWRTVVICPQRQPVLAGQLPSVPCHEDAEQGARCDSTRDAS